MHNKGPTQDAYTLATLEDDKHAVTHQWTGFWWLKMGLSCNCHIRSLNFKRMTATHIWQHRSPTHYGAEDDNVTYNIREKVAVH